MPGRPVHLPRFLSVGALALTLFQPSNAPVSTRYRIETKVETLIDLSAMGQGTQTQNVSQNAIITVALADTAGGRTLHVTIDSVGSDMQMPGAAEAMAKARGSWIHGFVDPRGKVRIVKASADSNDFVEELKATMVTFFPRVRPNPKAGDKWVDTTQVVTKTTNRAVTATTITNYTIGGDDMINGEKAIRIESAFSSSAAGTVENPMAGSMEMQSTDAGTGKFFMSADGRYLGGSSRAEGKATVKSAMVPDPIPLKITRTSTITVVK